MKMIDEKTLAKCSKIYIKTVKCKKGANIDVKFTVIEHGASQRLPRGRSERLKLVI